MSVRHIKPLSNHILVKRAEVTLSKGGIFLPDSAQEKPKQGEILAVGPGKMDDEGHVNPMELKAGDRVLFSAYGGSEVETQEEGEYLIVSEDDILAVVE